MDIKAFLTNCAGEWFTQRTNYDIDGSKVESNKANITVEFIPPDNAQITALCEQNRIEPSLSLGGLKYSWDTSVDWGKPKQQGNSLLVLVRDRAEPASKAGRENSQTGKLIKTAMNSNNVSGRYVLGEDDALTLIIETDEIYAEERQWFAGENLRLRTTVTKDKAGLTTTTFYSEIRRIPPKEKPNSQDAVAS